MRSIVCRGFLIGVEKCHLGSERGARCRLVVLIGRDRRGADSHRAGNFMYPSDPIETDPQAWLGYDDEFSGVDVQAGVKTDRPE